jgi:hypothetical protein
MNKLTILFILFLIFTAILIIDISYKPVEVKIVYRNITEQCNCDYNFCSKMMIDYKNNVNNFSKCYAGYC